MDHPPTSQLTTPRSKQGAQPTPLADQPPPCQGSGACHPAEGTILPSMMGVRLRVLGIFFCSNRTHIFAINFVLVARQNSLALTNFFCKGRFGGLSDGDFGDRFLIKNRPPFLQNGDFLTPIFDRGPSCGPTKARQAGTWIRAEEGGKAMDLAGDHGFERDQAGEDAGLVESIEP